MVTVALLLHVYLCIVSYRKVARDKDGGLPSDVLHRCNTAVRFDPIPTEISSNVCGASGGLHVRTRDSE